jgi:hypothetical protein
MLKPCNQFQRRNFPPDSGSKIAPLVDLMQDCTHLGPRERPEKHLVPSGFAWTFAKLET